jgi:ATP-dependent helicase HrpA
MQPVDFYRDLKPNFFGDLPIFEKRGQIVDALRRHQTLVVAGETASGKSTQLPLICLEAGKGRAGRIAITQPRRIAATSLARHVAAAHQQPPGEAIGYAIRFDQQCTDRTRLLFMTDGLLLTEIQNDPLLKRYDTIIVDEAHERSLTIDFLLGYLRRILPRRPDLSVVIASATIDTELFARAFDAPVIEVAGRNFPVDTWYMPREGDTEADRGYIEAAVDAVNSLIDLDEPGDILVFMPSERDILETRDRIVTRNGDTCRALPLFGRLSRSRQQHIFAPAAPRKVVIATNVAETSITVPGIRFVVDTGLARISRYAPRLRTSRLPIEPISRASADQRKGRCGRMRDGVCIRLYSEEDFAGRSEFTDPEIRRSNLAGVILRMKAMGLGAIERFPFLEPPDSRTIRDGYALLRELGAMHKDHRLTKLGQAMARMPLDPHIARMVLEARRHEALREMIIVAAGLSIADPRERPPERRGQADEMQRPFIDAGSDFLTYLRLWEAYQRKWNALKSQSAMRRFCREHFLSYTRFREWHEVHDQIRHIIRGRPGFALNQRPATPEAIHRCVLAGLLSNIARRSDTGNGYRAARGREIFLFPGSALFKAKPHWIVCHEIVETTRIFARTVAPIKPEWIEQIAGGLIRRRHASPSFNEESGIVEAVESASIFGLQIISGRRVNFGRIRRDEANAIFIEEGLVNMRLRSTHRFVRHNRALRQRLAAEEAKARTRGILAGDAAIAAFYRSRIPEVASVHDLNRVIRERKGDTFLMMSESDLRQAPQPEQAAALPDALHIGDKHFALRYAFEPGAPHDGITAKIPASSVRYLDDHTLGWLVTPLWAEKIHALLTQLPKSLRKQLAPLKQRAADCAASMSYAPEPFLRAMCRCIHQQCAVRLRPEQFDETRLPDYLQLRVEITDDAGRTVHAGRGMDALRSSRPKQCGDDADWRNLFRAHERKDLTSWDFDELPERQMISNQHSGFALYGYPALADSNGRIDLLLYVSAEEAMAVHHAGVRALTAHILETDWAWERNDLRFPNTLAMHCAAAGGADRIRAAALRAMHDYAFTSCWPAPRTRQAFEAHVAGAKKRLRGLGYRTVSVIEQTFAQHAACIRTLDNRQSKCSSRVFAPIHLELSAALDAYITRLRDPAIPYPMLERYPACLRALRARIERAYADPVKYRDRMALLQRYRDMARALNAHEGACSPGKRALIGQFECMVEEYAIHLFAQQEVKTLYPISEKRLRQKAERIQENDN